MVTSTAAFATPGPVAFEFPSPRAATAAVSPVEPVKAPDIKPAEVKRVEVKRAEVQTADVKTPDVKAPEVRTAEVRTAGAKAAPIPTGGAKDDQKDDKTGASAINPTFRYDSESQRTVMLMRDDKSGAVIQVPSELALRQYEQALKRVRDAVASSQGAAGQAAAPPSAIEAATLGVQLPHSSSPPVPEKPVAASSGGERARYTIVV